VRDTGIGIPEDMLPRVFELFTQVDGTMDRSQGSLGIGLAIVRSIIEMHGGTTEARSDGPGRGSEFVIRLPLLDPKRVPRPAASLATAAGAGGGYRILVVDDNEDSAAALAIVLRLCGNTVEMAHDGYDAVAAAQRFAPDVVLLDIGMPGLNGLEAARRIRAEAWGRGMMLVAQTGWGQDEDRRRSHEAGFDAHMTKPVDHVKLLKLLATAPRAAQSPPPERASARIAPSSP
jgi:CheY-like chemotaxis protein